jgi:hypothetical protein
VDLDRLYGGPDEGTAAVDDPPQGGCLKATERVPGLLTRWARAVDGRRFADNYLEESTPHAGSHWTDDGRPRDRRQLKNRERGEGRTCRRRRS